jgi:hypothetical protein
MCKTWRSELGPNAEVSYQKSVVSAVPAKNSIDHKERPIHRGVKESRELLSRYGLQISWRRELGEDPLPRGPESSRTSVDLGRKASFLSPRKILQAARRS